MIEPVVKELIVAVDAKRAFEVFTKEFGRSWPLASHSVSASAGKSARSVSMAPGVGGAIVEVMHDGSELIWGTITEWEPDKRLAFTWHLQRPESEQTHVRVTFSAQGAGTKVRLVHSGWEAHGADATKNRDQYLSGWDYVLAECYRGALVAQEA